VLATIVWEIELNTFRAILSAIAIVSCAPLFAQGLSSISNQEASIGLKDALTQGAGKAVELLGRHDGFLGNPKVKIPLPDALRQIEGGLRLMGMKRQADELVVSMNRAAESAVPEAKTLLVDAVRNMSVQDAKGILTGGDTAATEYFRRATSAQLTKRFLPIVSAWTSKVGLAEQYNSLVDRGASLGLMRKDEHIENYVTRKALDGLYLMIAEQERAIRQNPVGAATSAAKKVFGLLR
jgi:hypothetical protein